MDSLCKSVISLAPVSYFNSSIEPIQTYSSKSSDTQIGIGFPQNLFLEKHHSTQPSSQLLNLPSQTFFGTQLDLVLVSKHYCLISGTLINQVSTALYIKGVSDLQQYLKNIYKSFKKLFIKKLRIVMANLTISNKSSFIFQSFFNIFVAIFSMSSEIVTNRGCKITIDINWNWRIVYFDNFISI